jgi:hypothetical protein
MNKSVSLKTETTIENSFDPYQLVSDEDFNKNLNLLIAYYQMTRGETKKRFTGRR